MYRDVQSITLMVTLEVPCRHTHTHTHTHLKTLPSRNKLNHLRRVSTSPQKYEQCQEWANTIF